MLVELRKKSQITIPKKVIEQLSLQEGDRLEVKTVDGEIRLIPVATYPKNYIRKLEKEVLMLREKINSREQPVFDSVEELFEHLDQEED